MKKIVVSISLFLSFFSCSSEDDQFDYKTPEECGCVKQKKLIKKYLSEVGQPTETTYSETWLVCEPDTNGNWYFEGSNGLQGENEVYISSYFKVDCQK